AGWWGAPPPATPSPFGGEGWGGGSGGGGTAVQHSSTPTPDPSPQGGGEEFAALLRCKLAPTKDGVPSEISSSAKSSSLSASRGLSCAMMRPRWRRFISTWTVQMVAPYAMTPT